VKRPKPSGSIAAFERRVKDDLSERYRLSLYVAGTTSHSVRAVRNITRLCETEIPGQYDLEIIDVYQQPARAAEDQIVAVPTLVKHHPPPLRKLIGDLSQERRVRKGLGLPEKLIPGSGSL